VTGNAPPSVTRTGPSRTPRAPSPPIPPADSAISPTHRVSILILHHGPERGPQTAEVLRALLPELRARGIKVVPVSTLTGLEAS
jgi:hypothetical protein